MCRIIVMSQEKDPIALHARGGLLRIGKEIEQQLSKQLAMSPAKQHCKMLPSAQKEGMGRAN